MKNRSSQKKTALSASDWKILATLFLTRNLLHFYVPGLLLVLTNSYCPSLCRLLAMHVPPPLSELLLPKRSPSSICYLSSSEIFPSNRLRQPSFFSDLSFCFSCQQPFLCSPFSFNFTAHPSLVTVSAIYHRPSMRVTLWKNSNCVWWGGPAYNTLK